MLFGICGRIGSGKTTTANYLVEKGFTELTFGEPVKKIVEIVYGFDKEIINPQTPHHRRLRENLKDPIYGITARQALEYIGTDIFREKVDNNVWVNVIKRNIQKLGGNIVVSDCRFKNEIEMIRELGGKLIVLYQKNNDFNIDKNEHRSRWEFLTCLNDNDYYIKNNKTINDLYKNIDKIIKISHF